MRSMIWIAGLAGLALVPAAFAAPSFKLESSTIKPGATLVFDVELLEIAKK